VPLGITVEGANILTRSMIIYGQGAIRCHPFALEEIEAVAAGDIARLDRAFFGHVGHVFATAVRALALGASGGRLERSAPRGPLRRELQRLSRLSAAFALVSEGAMVTLGGRLERKESITGRLGDALAWLYLGSAAVHRFERDGRPEGDLAVARFGLAHALGEAEAALAGVLRNLPARRVAAARTRLSPRSARRGPPRRAGGRGGAGAPRRRILPRAAHRRHLPAAVREGRLARAPGDALAHAGRDAGVISEVEFRSLAAADVACDEVIRVDSFAPEEYARLRR
jgi:acyl-CoA dehydrogenase